MKIRLVCATILAITALALLTAADLKPTRTAFESSAREVVAGTSVTLTAVVTAAIAEDGVPGGSVEFFDGATSLGTAQLAEVDGRAEGSLGATLELGPHPITVRYDGNAVFGGSVSLPEFVLVVAE